LRLLIQQLFCAVLLAVVFVAGAEVGAQTEPTSLSGLAIDDAEAELVGNWTRSTAVKPYLGESYLHDGAAGKGEKSAKFSFRVPIAGEYHLLIAYTPGGNRSTKVPLTIESVDGRTTVMLDQRKRPQLRTGFQPIGQFTFSDTADGTVLIETTGTTAHVIVDGIRLLTASEFKVVAKKETGPRSPTAVVNKSKKDKSPKAQPKPPTFGRQSVRESFAKITPEQFDALLAGSSTHSLEPVNDIKFLRRVTLDLVGRQPMLEEYRAFVADDSASRRDNVIERLLTSTALGTNWGNYWSDVIAARQAEPQLTYLNYKPFRGWLQDEINAGTGWDEMVFRMVTAIGSVGDGPAGTFIGFHQGERNNLAGESARVFLGLRISCAQCHDHPFVDMPQTTFHGMAAFFARTKVKLPWNDSNGIEISSASKGEHKMPGGKKEMVPTVYLGQPLDLGLSDLDRREQLAYWIVRGDNPFFARAYVNHLQARLLGRGFFDPIDDLGEGATALNPAAHDALADHFIASGFDMKSVLRLLVSTRRYQSHRPAQGDVDFVGATPKKLRGDEVFDSLVAAIELPNAEKIIEASTDETRFPPPVKTTRDLVNEVFGFDPSTRDELVTRTMKQAIFMMNSDQLHRLIDASAEEETMLSRLVHSESDDRVVIDVLYVRVLARRPTDAERAILLRHIESVRGRGSAFEDILWSLLNSAEFTTRN
jgi:hypothetical protein